ncbi:MAG: 5-(carboxyamino)imidazole ribonucleotide synthase [Alphaproteobacteria bacterium]|nr:MAG: 5-(carboxyamino)imidazole ribonucleotide synthase [Alphaproteobacteria bacterium]
MSLTKADTLTPTIKKKARPLTAPLPKGSTIGILGSGQLGQMLAQAAKKLGYKTHIYSPERDTPAGLVADRETVADYLDLKALAAFAEQVDVVTYEFENVPADTAAYLSSSTTLYPNANVLAIAQDRWTEKTFLQDIGERTAPCAKVDSQDDLERAVRKMGLPAVLKTRRFGYDGKGQIMLRGDSDVEGAFEQLGGVAAILEGFVNFSREISVVAARSAEGEIACFDPAENIHEDHILARSIAPARIPETLLERAKETATNIMIQLQYVGVIGVELFETDAGGLVVNEIAPRVHNSGHWTQDACAASQFEQHIRAICRLPLADPSRHSDAVMVNLIGEAVRPFETATAKSDEFIHLYGKRQARPGRKMGHVNRIYPLGFIARHPDRL